MENTDPENEQTLEQLAHEKADKRAKARTDKLFLAGLLGYDFVADVHTELFDNYLQITPGVTLFEQDSVKDRMVLWPRGHFKTSSIVVEVIQLILNFPDIRILLMQGTVKNTRGLLKEIKSHFIGDAHNSNLAELFPEYCVETKLGTAESFTVPARVRKNLKEGTVTIASPKTVKAGQHYDAGFFDDLVNEQNYRSADLVRKAIEDFNHYTPLIDPGGYKFVTGTRYTFGDLYEWIIEKNAEILASTGKHNWDISIKQCWTVNADGTRTVIFPQRKIADGRLIGFTEEMLLSIQAEDPAMFSAQYLNIPVSAERQLFTDVLMMSHVKLATDEQVPLAGLKVLFVDLASSTNSHSDHSVILTGTADRFGRCYLVDVVGGKFSPNELAFAVMEAALKHRPLKIMIEATASATYFVELVKTLASARNLVLPLDFIKVKNNKDAKHIRISSLEGTLKSNRLFFLAGLPNWERILKEFTQYPARHDDYPDTIALMVNYFQENTPSIPLPRLIDHPMFAPEPESPILPRPSQDDGMGSSFCC